MKFGLFSYRRICRSVVLSLTAVTSLTILSTYAAPAGSDRTTETKEEATVQPQSLDGARAAGIRESRLRTRKALIATGKTPEANLSVFRDRIAPILKTACVDCHGPETQEGNIRIDTLNPDLIHGEDVNWWLEVAAVLTNGEMPPPEYATLAEDDRSAIVQWLTTEIQTASMVRRAEQGHSSFRRLTRYEYNYALQDLLGLPFEFAGDLPPDAASEDGFQNSSEMLHMSSMQFRYYRELGRKALQRATVGKERPVPVYWSIPMHAAASKSARSFESDARKKKEQFKDDPDKLAKELDKLSKRYSGNRNAAHYLDRSNDQSYRISWGYGGARHAFPPVDTLPTNPELSPTVAVLPARQKMIVELGNQIPDEGTLRIRIRACRTSEDHEGIPTLHWDFGWQASNNSAASTRMTESAVTVLAPPGKPEFYEWEIPLSEIELRNPMRRTARMGATPSPSEYLRLENVSLAKADVQIDYIEIAAPVFDQWPPESHENVMGTSNEDLDETSQAREILTRMMKRAWRRDIEESEIERKLTLFENVRPHCADFQDAIIETLATVLASPNFLYVGLQGSDTEADSTQATVSSRDADGMQQINDFELAARLSFFLWCSLPDQSLLDAASNGSLKNNDVLLSHVDRMLQDKRSERFSKQFVRQWLGMELLDYLSVSRKVFPQFDRSLRESMQKEPINFFRHLLNTNGSVIDFLHADYSFVDERLARHYGIQDVYGPEFRQVRLGPESNRGGLLTQAGLLAMNSDGKDSHPLKRGIWMLDRLLNDPPPPPPPAVPEIDLADPEIAKLTLKQRLEDHRNDAACLSCHSKIDPWGIAFENFDAIGQWRTQIKGQSVDASSTLFNGEPLNGMDGLKRFLLANRQDQFARALTHKMLTFALGRPLTFADHSSVDQIAADLRKNGDGLQTLVKLIVASELFKSY